MFTLDEQPEQTIRVERYGLVDGLLRLYRIGQVNGITRAIPLFEELPQDFTFANRRLTYLTGSLPDTAIIILREEILRALDWKEGDEITWTVYSDRTNFFKVPA